MRTRILLFLLLLVALLAAACKGRNGASTESAQSSQSSEQADVPLEYTLTEAAASAFMQLPAVSLDEGQSLRTFHIVPAQTKATYVVDEELFADATRKYGLAVGKTKVIGETNDVEGLLQIDLSVSTIGANRFVVYLPTLRTDQTLRDGWIRENALESDRFPLAIFIATQIHGAPEKYQAGDQASFRLEGELTMRGTALPAVWDVSARLQNDSIAGTIETRLRMTDLGFDPPNFANTLTVQDEFTVRIDFVARER